MVDVHMAWYSAVKLITVTVLCRVTNSVSLWFGVKNNLIKLVCILQLFHISFEFDANCQEIISLHFSVLFWLTLVTETGY